MLSDVEGTDTDRATLAGLAAALGRDELRVLVLIAERLAAGQRTYGRLDLAADARDWRREALEEAADGLVYVACGLVKAAPAGGAGSETRQRAAGEVKP